MDTSAVFLMNDCHAIPYLSKNEMNSLSLTRPKAMSFGNGVHWSRRIHESVQLLIGRDDYQHTLISLNILLCFTDHNSDTSRVNVSLYPRQNLKALESIPRRAFTWLKVTRIIRTIPIIKFAKLLHPTGYPPLYTG